MIHGIEKLTIWWYKYWNLGRLRQYVDTLKIIDFPLDHIGSVCWGIFMLQDCTTSIDQCLIAGFQSIIYSMQLFSIKRLQVEHVHLRQGKNAISPQNFTKHCSTALVWKEVVEPVRIEDTGFIRIMKTKQCFITNYNSMPNVSILSIFKHLLCLAIVSIMRKNLTEFVLKAEIMIYGALRRTIFCWQRTSASALLLLNVLKQYLIFHK